MSKINCWICGSKKILRINIVSDTKIHQLLCNECFFIFDNIKIQKINKVKYYSKLSSGKLIDRYNTNEYFDTARFLNYINLV